MRHLAIAGNIPAILVVQRMADLALDSAARVVALDRLQAVRAAVLFMNCQAYDWPALAQAALWLCAQSMDGGRGARS